MLRLYSIQVSFGYIFSFARSDSFGHIYTTILLMLICSRKGHFRPELSTHPDNAGYTQDLDQILISNSPATFFSKTITLSIILSNLYRSSLHLVAMVIGQSSFRCVVLRPICHLRQMPRGDKNMKKLSKISHIVNNVVISLQKFIKLICNGHWVVLLQMCYIKLSLYIIQYGCQGEIIFQEISKLKNLFCYFVIKVHQSWQKCSLGCTLCVSVIQVTHLPRKQVFVLKL